MSVRQSLSRRLVIVAVALLATSALAPAARAAISFDASAGTGWWFDPANWGTHGVGAAPPYRVPPTSDGTTVTDTNLNNGWDFAGEGVVYDPDNDPFYLSLTDDDYLGFPEGFDRDTIWRLYVTTGAASANNKLTIKSGSLEVVSGASAGYVLLGRGGTNPGLKGVIVQTGGSFRVDNDNMDVGTHQTNPGNGEYHYYGGTLEVGLNAAAARGIRLSAGGGSGTADSGYFGMHNGGAAGHVRVHTFTVGSHIDSTFGTTQSVSTVEFFATSQGTRPVQVLNNLSINHQDDSGGSGSTRSAVLQLTLAAAPQIDGGGVPINLGLFDVGGAITGTSQRFYTDSIANDGQLIDEGAIVSATYLGSTYNWTISYSGDISWSDYDNSVVSSITGPGTGGDVVLIGHSSTIVGVPGDVNGDNKVDGTDFLVWQRGAHPSGELAAWQTNYGAGLGGAGATAAAVPEPAAALLALAACGALLVVRTRRA
ncbi:MAG: hypothetical protein KF847_08600 [Pirellulales bacterium]|nr:hypothetical protein [Pirellulales bacterium]